MANTYTVRGFYGTGNPCLVFCFQVPYSLSTAYTVKGNKNINFTSDEVNEGVNVETLSDFYSFTSRKPIEDEWELMEAIENP